MNRDCWLCPLLHDGDVRKVDGYVEVARRPGPGTKKVWCCSQCALSFFGRHALNEAEEDTSC